MNNILEYLEDGDLPSVGENTITVQEEEDTTECFISNNKSNLHQSIIQIDRKQLVTIIRPINTIIESHRYFKPKYYIKEFLFEGFDVEIEELGQEEYGIEGLPKGFTRSVIFGLGLEKKYTILINTITKHFRQCERLIISRIRATKINQDNLIISYSDFEKIRKGIDRNQDLFYKEGQIAKESFIYDNIFNFLNPTKYPIIKLPPRKEVIYKVLRNTELRKSTESDKSALSLLKDTTDLSFLSILMSEF